MKFKMGEIFETKFWSMVNNELKIFGVKGQNSIVRDYVTNAQELSFAMSDASKIANIFDNTIYDAKITLDQPCNSDDEANNLNSKIAQELCACGTVVRPRPFLRVFVKELGMSVAVYSSSVKNEEVESLYYPIAKDNNFLIKIKPYKRMNVLGLAASTRFDTYTDVKAFDGSMISMCKDIIANISTPLTEKELSDSSLMYEQGSISEKPTPKYDKLIYLVGIYNYILEESSDINKNIVVIEFFDKLCEATGCKSLRQVVAKMEAVFNNPHSIEKETWDFVDAVNNTAVDFVKQGLNYTTFASKIKLNKSNVVPTQEKIWDTDGHSAEDYNELLTDEYLDSLIQRIILEKKGLSKISLDGLKRITNELLQNNPQKESMRTLLVGTIKQVIPFASFYPVKNDNAIYGGLLKTVICDTIVKMFDSNSNVTFYEADTYNRIENSNNKFNKYIEKIADLQQFYKTINGNELLHSLSTELTSKGVVDHFSRFNDALSNISTYIKELEKGYAILRTKDDSRLLVSEKTTQEIDSINTHFDEIDVYIKKADTECEYIKRMQKTIDLCHKYVSRHISGTPHKKEEKVNEMVNKILMCGDGVYKGFFNVNSYCTDFVDEHEKTFKELVINNIVSLVLRHNVSIDEITKTKEYMWVNEIYPDINERSLVAVNRYGSILSRFYSGLENKLFVRIFEESQNINGRIVSDKQNPILIDAINRFIDTSTKVKKTDATFKCLDKTTFTKIKVNCGKESMRLATNEEIIADNATNNYCIEVSDNKVSLVCENKELNLFLQRVNIPNGKDMKNRVSDCVKDYYFLKTKIREMIYGKFDDAQQKDIDNVYDLFMKILKIKNNYTIKQYHKDLDVYFNILYKLIAITKEHFIGADHLTAFNNCLAQLNNIITANSLNDDMSISKRFIKQIGKQLFDYHAFSKKVNLLTESSGLKFPTNDTPLVIKYHIKGFGDENNGKLTITLNDINNIQYGLYDFRRANKAIDALLKYGFKNASAQTMLNSNMLYVEIDKKNMSEVYGKKVMSTLARAIEQSPQNEIETVPKKERTPEERLIKHKNKNKE